MRILIYSYNYWPEPIGIAPLMTELAEGLVKRGYEVRVVTAMPWYPKIAIHQEYQGKLYCTEERNGVTIQRCYVHCSNRRTLLNRALFELSFAGLSFLQALRGKRPDILLLTVPGLPVGIPAALLRFLYRCPIVLNLQDILPEAAVRVNLLKEQRLIRIFEWLEKFNYRTATKISVIAEGFTQNLLRKGVAAEKIEEISNWVDVDFIKPLPYCPNGFRRKYQLENKFVVLYSGNIALTQGIENVIRSAIYLQNLPEIVVVIVGAEKQLAKLDKFRQELGAENVRLFPFQPREQLPEMLASANVGLVMQKSNVVAFNMPSKIQVLLASGRPIVASIPAGGTAAKAIARSGGGLIVPPEDPYRLAQAIQELYRDPQKVKALGEKGRQYAVEHYGFDKALDSYEQLFTALRQERVAKRTYTWVQKQR